MIIGCHTTGYYTLFLLLFFFGALQTAAEWQTGNVMLQAVW